MAEKKNIQYRVLYNYFPIVDAFSKRELPRKVAINIGRRVMRLREFFQAAEERRQILVEKHSEKTESGHPVITEDGRVKMVDQAAFEAEWKGMLQSAIEDYPVFPKRMNAGDLPEDVTGIEVEALLRLGLLDTPEVWD